MSKNEDRLYVDIPILIHTPYSKGAIKLIASHVIREADFRIQHRQYPRWVASFLWWWHNVLSDINFIILQIKARLILSTFHITIVLIYWCIYGSISDIFKRKKGRHYNSKQVRI